MSLFSGIILPFHLRKFTIFSVIFQRVYLETGCLEPVALFTKIEAEIKVSKIVSGLVEKFLETGEL